MSGALFIVVCRLFFDRETQKIRVLRTCRYSTFVYSNTIIGEISIANVPYSCQFPNHHHKIHKVIKLHSLQSEISMERMSEATSENRPCITVIGELLDGGVPGPSEPRSRGGSRIPSNDSFLVSPPECIQLWRAADEGSDNKLGLTTLLYVSLIHEIAHWI